MPVGQGEKVQFDQSVFIGFLAEERQVEDVFICSSALNPLSDCSRMNSFNWGCPYLGGVAKM